MTDRILPRDEWAKIAHTEIGPALAHLPADHTSIVVVEDGETIVGCWALFTVCHAEGVWIAPSHRGTTSVARRLWKAMRALVTAAGGRSVVTAAVAPEIHAMLRKRSIPLPQEYVLCL